VSKALRRSAKHAHIFLFFLKRYLVMSIFKIKRLSFSGGVMIIYKSNLHKGITEVKNLTRSETRIWIKLDRNHFGFQKDIMLISYFKKNKKDSSLHLSPRPCIFQVETVKL
jgi:hypothetical protein